MQRLRNVLADVLVAVVLVVLALWLLRGVLRLVGWGVNLVVLIILVALVLRLASKLRG